jgi:hypothetical protein
MARRGVTTTIRSILSITGLKDIAVSALQITKLLAATVGQDRVSLAVLAPVTVL